MSLLETLSVEYLCAQNPKVKELKKLAKQYKKSKDNQSHTLQQCQDIIARKYGFNNWHHFIHFIKNHYEDEKHMESYLKVFFYDTPEDNQSVLLGSDMNFQQQVWLAQTAFRTHNLILGHHLYQEYDAFLVSQLIEKDMGLTWIIDGDENVQPILDKAKSSGKNIIHLSPLATLNTTHTHPSCLENFVQCYLEMKKSRSIPNDVLNELDYSSVQALTHSIHSLPTHILEKIKPYPQMSEKLQELAMGLEKSFYYHEDGYPLHTLEEFTNKDVVVMNINEFENPKLVGLFFYYMIVNAIHYTFSHSVLTSYPEIHKRRTPIPRGKKRVLVCRNTYLGNNQSIYSQLRSLGTSVILSYPDEKTLKSKAIGAKNEESLIATHEYITANVLNFYYQNDSDDFKWHEYPLQKTHNAQLIALQTGRGRDKIHMLNFKA